MTGATPVHPLLEVRDLCVCYGAGRLALPAVDGVSFSLYRGQSLGVVGESGSGKSTLARAILKLETPARGDMYFDRIALSALRGRALRDYRRQVQMIFQDPWGSLNPRMTAGQALTEVLRVHGKCRGVDCGRRVLELLEAVGLMAEAAGKYPHEFSGGQRQRVGIARTLAVEPALIVADEPVSALDVSIQAQILNLLREVRERFGLTYLFIAHDLGVVRYMCEAVVVMFAGRMVETGPVSGVYGRPAHPYTRLLLEAVPALDRPGPTAAAAGSAVTDEAEPAVTGCAFHPRCPLAVPRCRTERPALRSLGEGRCSACHLAA